MSEEDADDQWQEEASNPATNAQRLETLCADPHMRIIVASNPAAPAHLLERLAQDQYIRVRQAVAGNPNVPWQTLEHLAWEFPHEFLHNPVGPLHLLTHPEQISTDYVFWEVLLQEAALPSCWWHWLRGHPALSTVSAVRLHIQGAGEAPFFSSAPQENDEYTQLILVELLTAACGWGTSPPAPGLANQMVTTLEQVIREYLQLLAHSPNEKVRFAVAGNPQTPVEQLRTLAQDDDYPVRFAVAGNPQTPVEVLCTLAQDEDEVVRNFVAWNQQTPTEILPILALDDSAHVRMAVAENPQTAVEILQALAQDHDFRVRKATARNPQTPAEQLRTLAQNKEAETRRAVAENPQTPVEILQALAKDHDPRVRARAASHPQIPEEVLCALAQDQNATVRWMANLIQRLEVETGGQLREQAWRGFLSDEQDRRWDRWIGDLPVEEQLAQIVSLNVSEHICQIILTVLAADWDTMKIRSAFAMYMDQEFEFYESLCDWRVHYQHLTASFIPPVVLQMLAVSPRWEVRYLVALHARTPWATRQHLSQDGNRYVRAMARAKAERWTSRCGSD